MSFQDHFSAHAGEYARYRPDYPPALFDWLAAQAPSRQLAWECACGSGQATLALAQHFEHLIATEPSAEQLAAAPRHPRIDYRCEPAERSSLADASVDLIAVAQALHWFDMPAFFAEASRVLRPGGVLAAWCYETCQVAPAVDAVVAHFYDDTIGPYWPPERRWIEQGYAGIDLPFPELIAPAFAMTQHWTLAELVGYFGTWSATRRYREARQHDPLPELWDQLEPAWGDPTHARPVSWPLRMRACRKPA
ncbi:class I SAM-dependent methyltransferase [Chitinimonas lacunae]|uniref:Class I SAM-dependent methyltransferase n=1 Tax=Chitinimonas lacunae TaxID=1963018 RepID=A0ABV8MN99_9NEIS